MIYLNGRPVESMADQELGPQFQDVLTMIPEGAEWMRRALNNPGMPPVYVSSGPQLLRQIQTGLHADDMVCFMSFRAHIDKILTMSPEDTAQLAVVYNNPALDTAQNLGPVFERNGITGYSTLAQVSAWIAAAPALNIGLLSAPSFSGLLLLHPFMQQVQNDPQGLNEQAVYFAEQRATSAADFVDNYWFYTNLAGTAAEQSLTPALQNSNVQAVYNQLEPLAFRLLFTPNAGPGKTRLEMAAAIQHLAGSSSFIGYETLAAAVRNLAGNIPAGSQQQAQLEAAVQHYLNEIKALIASASPGPGSLSQDGRRMVFRYENDSAVAFAGADMAGNVFLLPETRLKTPGNTAAAAA